MNWNLPEGGKDGFLLELKMEESYLAKLPRKNKTNNPTVNGAWAPVYLINKMLLGLWRLMHSVDRKKLYL